jgi:predicted DCC family thiol-disulfide oxidoreductase YuxK
MTTESPAASEASHPVVLYDGVCGLCNRAVQFILRHDKRAIFRFASLQSPLAARILTRHAANPSDLDTMYLVLNAGDQNSESLLSRSDAASNILRLLGGFWGASARPFTWVPRPVRDFAYRAIARSRYRIFGKYDACPLPSEATRTRFLDL